MAAYRRTHGPNRLTDKKLTCVWHAARIPVHTVFPILHFSTQIFTEGQLLTAYYCRMFRLAFLPLSRPTPSTRRIPSSYRVRIWYGKTRMTGLQSGEGRMMTDSVVWTQYINVTDTHTLHFWTSTLALPWICVLGQRFDHYECGRLSWLGQLYGAL